MRTKLCFLLLLLLVLLLLDQRPSLPRIVILKTLGYDLILILLMRTRKTLGSWRRTPTSCSSTRRAQMPGSWSQKAQWNGLGVLTKRRYLGMSDKRWRVKEGNGCLTVDPTDVVIPGTEG